MTARVQSDRRNAERQRRLAGAKIASGGDGTPSRNNLAAEHTAGCSKRREGCIKWFSAFDDAHDARRDSCDYQKIW